MAQEREKRRIVIASILKPIDDTRMFEKMGCSLARHCSADIFLIGFASSAAIAFPEIRFISLGLFERLSLRRWWAKWRVFIEASRVKPAFFIFATHELMLPAIGLKLIFNTRIIYDVRENYYRNIRHSESLPWLVRLPLAGIVRFKEKLLAPAIDHFFLAEKGYEKEFKFHRSGWTVLENKALIPPNARIRKRGSQHIQLLFSGTLAESTGVFRAIQLAKDLHQLQPGIILTIAGYAATQHVRERIRMETASFPFIRLVGVDRLIPHSKIVTLILESDAGIISYPAAMHTINAKPTKLFEYLQGTLPIILEDHWPWIKHYSDCQPFALYNFTNPDPASLLIALNSRVFYPRAPNNASWESEERKLLEAIENIA